MKDLSIIIPARNEEFLGITIKNILDNISANTEIIAVLDGYSVPVPDIPEDKRVTVICHTNSVGQRAACNEAARLSTGKYIMKLDAHCSIDKDMDSKMLSVIQDNWTMVPTMRNLHAFNWICENGHERYQSPSGPCTICGKETKKDMKWIGKNNPQSNSYCFDSEPHFQYFREFSKRPEGKGQLTESMSLQGSCFMVSREKYFELNLCDETFGSWGSQGIEVACKTWLSGGIVMVNHNTWYAHMFRTQGGDFGFPYQNGGANSAKKKVKELFFNNNWDKQIYPLSWLIEKFAPVPGWSKEDIDKLKGIETKPLTKGVLYYTDNAIDENILKMCQDQLLVASKEATNQIVSVSQKPIDLGENIVMPLERSAKSMFIQILEGLKKLKTDIVFFAEHDILYTKEHFDFIPTRKDTFYYNTNVWFLRWSDGHCLYYGATQLSGLCAYREELIKHFEERVKMIEEIGFSRNMGFEPMTHNRIKWENQYRFEQWQSVVPNVDIKHGKNQLRARWKKEEFRRVPKVWIENNEIPFWGKGDDIINGNRL